MNPLPGNAQTRQDGQTGHSCLQLNQQKGTYTLEIHKQGEMVRQVIYAQSTKDHIQPENAQTRQDGQTGHLCLINKRSHTIWKCTNKARWSEGSFTLNQQKVTYRLEMHKQGKMVKQVIYAQSKKVTYSLEMHKWSDRSSMLNQKKITYKLELHK